MDKMVEAEKILGHFFKSVPREAVEDFEKNLPDNVLEDLAKLPFGDPGLDRKSVV